jgi:hypothetical protein
VHELLLLLLVHKLGAERLGEVLAQVVAGAGLQGRERGPGREEEPPPPPLLPPHTQLAAAGDASPSQLTRQLACGTPGQPWPRDSIPAALLPLLPPLPPLPRTCSARLSPIMASMV